MYIFNKYFGPNILCLLLLLLEVWLRLPCWILESPKKIGTATLIVNCTKWQKILGPDLKNCTVYLAKVSHSFARITILRHFYCFWSSFSENMHLIGILVIFIWSLDQRFNEIFILSFFLNLQYESFYMYLDKCIQNQNLVQRTKPKKRTSE